MSTESVCTSKSSPATPLSATLKSTATDKLLLAGVKTFMSLSIVLACKGLATDCTDEWSLIGVGAKMRTEVVSSRESLRTKSALERRRMLLLAFAVSSIRGSPFRVRQVQNVIALV